ncbi:2,3-bisphosphoglycerate-dependent phosphoglycerate mutase [Luteimicrobium sp. DT211]|uniref:2,3-bisphosphoglycerate-dependent phosphoglycerate mutase n=1 Tax=Luteimicrobium sp. DT211 TaxID=3393412 RepID=UPI003CF792C2
MTALLVLLRHGQSQANADGLFTGLLDVPLTEAGRREAARAAHLLSAAQLLPEAWFSSPLLRARQTVQVLGTTVRNPLARVVYDWRLAERNYGALTGQTKAAVLEEHGEARFREWRRSVDIAPPPMTPAQRAALAPAPDSLGYTESLSDVISRVDEVWRERIRPAVRQSGSVLVVAHGNSLRALCTVLDHLDQQEVRDLNIPTGHPLVYRLDDDHRPLVRAGSYLDPAAALAAAELIAREGGT